MKYEIPGDMKKTILFFIAILIGVSVAGQLVGDGLTPGTAYCGTATSAQSWHYAYNGGIIYVGQTGNKDLTIGTGGSLNIEAGVTVMFCTTSSNLIITGTGYISADGTSSNKITFTRNYPSINSWGHISFESMDPSAGASTIDHSIIEYGDVSSTSLTPVNPNQYGGAIQTDFSNLTISNCEIRNNKAGWGGGIFVGDGRFPSISSCYIHDNTATTSGGGIYFWKNSSSTFSNSIITYNSCTGSGGGGGIFVGGAAKNVAIINCTISSNTANDQSLGHNIKIFNNTNSPKPQFINSIIWYPANSIVGSSYTNDFDYCAIQDPPLSYPSCITLNASNEGTNPSGPFFASMSGNNWSLQYLSPCRDAGTMPSPPVPYDYNGNPRVGNYDIGAYEVQYSRWNGTANDNLWTNLSNWDGNIDPSTGLDYVIIPSGLTHYPTASSPDFTLGAGKNMILQPGAQASFGAFTNNGTFKLQCNATDMSSLICSSVTGSGTDSIELYLSGGGGPNYKWHYISTPISYLNVSTFAPTYSNNVASWNDDALSGTLVSGWIDFDGYVYSTKVIIFQKAFDHLIPGIGYDYYAIAGRKYTLSGQINTSDVTLNLSYAVDDALHGFNLLGNPFPSGLNWDDIANNVAFPANTSKTIYFTRDNAQCSYVVGVGVPGDVTGIIPPEQGFFVKTNSTGNSITLAAGARSQGTIHSRYKGSTIIPLVRLALTEGHISDETVVRFDPLAKTNLDYDFDALKMFVSTTSTQIYSALGGTDYSINGQPFPDTLITIPVVVNLTIDGNHNITVPQLQGLDNYDVTLTDKITGFTANLKTTPTLSFSASAGTIADRFTLKISKIVTGIENPVVSKNTFNIYPANSVINIQTLSDVWEGKIGSVKVMDLTGKTVGDLSNAEFSKNSLVQVAVPGAKGMYMVEIRSGIMRYVGKVMIR